MRSVGLTPTELDEQWVTTTLNIFTYKIDTVSNLAFLKSSIFSESNGA